MAVKRWTYEALEVEGAIRVREAGQPGGGGRSAPVVELRGDLDMKRSSDLSPALEAILADCPARGSLYLDLAGVGYISSTGIGLLTLLLTRARERNIGLILTRVPPKVMNVLGILGLVSFFAIEPEAPEAER